MPSVQTLVPVMLNHVHEGRLTLEQLVDLTAHGPQRICNTAGKGRLAVGYDAGFTSVDLQETLTITDDWIIRKYGWTPYNGMKATRWPIATIIRGATVMRDGAAQDSPARIPVRFQDTMGKN